MSGELHPAGASLPLPGGSRDACVRLRALLCGECLVPPAWFFRQAGRGAALRALGVGVPESKWVRCPIGALLLEHPTAGAILLDTGLHPCTSERLKDNFGRLNAYIFRTLRTSPQRSLPAQLRARDIDPDDISLVLMTHLHVDHASAMSELHRARFVCTAAEWRAAQARFGVWWGYVRRQLPAPSRVNTIDFGAASAQQHAPFARTLDLLGDGSIRLLYTPGHTTGHMSVLARLAGRQALLIGDAVYTLRHLRERILPWRTADDGMYMQTMSELTAFSEQDPDALMIPTHDIEVWESLDALY